jgi:sterol 3beta-glucosyltransferase
MKILIITLGSRGDVQPYVALGKGLQEAGHEVTICTSSSFEGFIREHGLRYGYMNNDIMALIDSDAGRDAMENTTNLLQWIKTALILVKQVKPLQRMMLKESWLAAQEADPDLVIFHPKAFGGIHIAEKLGVPVMMAIPLPVFVPTAEFPNIVFPNWTLGGWYNRLTYSLALKGARSQYGGLVNEFRQETLHLPKQPRSADDLHTTKGHLIPVLHSYSPCVAPEPKDWPENAIATGYWFLERLDEWQPPAHLQSFLEAGEPPVYVGFGSMAGRDPARTTRIVIDAIQQAGVRAIIATGWGGLEVSDLPDMILKLDQAPHDWLFPHMSAVVHHGGAGTTAAGLRAGKPTIICPFFGDQPFWGRRVHQLGVGTEPIPQKKLSAQKLAAALHTAVTDETMRQRAATLGEKIRHEDGIGKAIEVIEALGGGR